MKISRNFIKFGRIFAMSAALILCLMCCMPLSSCEEQDEEQRKYDVAIRVACSDGEIYEFPVGEDEKHLTIPYDGTERTYWVDSYNLPDHPRYSDEWLSPSGEGANVFELSIAMESMGEVKSIHNQGLYCVNVYADSTSDIWNFRHVYLFVTIK